MKLLILLATFLMISPTAYSDDWKGLDHDRMCKQFGIPLPKFPSEFVKWTRRDREGCLVEDKNGIIDQFLNAEEKKKENAHQIAACKCLASKGKLQRWLYHNRNKKHKTDWVDKVVWKKVGDHFRGRMYENFTDMLRWDNMLKQGEINKNYLKYAEKCYFKKITTTVNDLLIGKYDKEYKACRGKRTLIKKRIKLIFGKDKIEDFVEDFQDDLSDVVKNKISEKNKEKNFCLSYKNYLAMKSPSRIRYEIMEKFRTEECKSDMKKCYEDFKEMFAVKTSHAGPYYTDKYLKNSLGDVSGDNKSFMTDITTELRNSRKNAIVKNSELRDDPFLQALLNEKEAKKGIRSTEGYNFFKKMVKAKDADLFFTDPQVIKSVFQQRNEQCGELAGPEFLSKVLCEDEVPPVSMDMIQEDIAPELSRDGENNQFGNKATEYLTAKYMCTTEKQKIKWDGKKIKIPAWSPLPKNKAYEDLMRKVLKPQKRMISDLEIEDLRAKDPSLEVESDYEKFNKQVCNLPGVKRACAKQKGCYSLKHIINGGTINDLIAQYISDPEKQKAIKDLLKSYKSPYRTTDPESGDLLNLLMSYLYRGIDFKKTKHSEVYHIAKNILDMHHLRWGTNKAKNARIIHALKDTPVLQKKLDEIKGDPEKYKALREALGLSGDQEIDFNSMSQEDFHVFAREGFGSFKKMKEAGAAEVKEGSAASRAFAEVTGEMIGTETGEEGSSYFSDYNLGGDQAREDAINNYNPTPDQLSSSWAPCNGKTCTDANGDISTTGTDTGIPYNRTVNVDPTNLPQTTGDDGVNGTDGFNGYNGANGINGGNGSGNGTVFTPDQRVFPSERVVTTRRTSFGNPNSTVVTIGGKKRVLVPSEDVGGQEESNTNTSVDFKTSQNRRTDNVSDDPIRDENMDQIEQNLRDYKALDDIANIRQQLNEEQYKTRKTLNDIYSDREMAKFNTGNTNTQSANIVPGNRSFDSGSDDSNSGGYTPTYGVSTDSSKKSDFNHVMTTGELPNSGGANTARGPAGAGASGAAGLGGVGLGGGISGSALGGIAGKLDMKDPSVLMAIKNAKTQLQAENIFPYQLVQEMGISEVVGTFGLEGQSFYALEIKDYQFTLHKIDLSKKVIEEGGLSGKRKELLASLTLLRGSVGAESTFKQIQNSYVVESSKTLSTNEDKKKLFLKTMTYEELDQLLVTAVEKELKIKK